MKELNEYCKIEIIKAELIKYSFQLSQQYGIDKENLLLILGNVINAIK